MSKQSLSRRSRIGSVVMNSADNVIRLAECRRERPHLDAQWTAIEQMIARHGEQVVVAILRTVERMEGSDKRTVEIACRKELARLGVRL